MASKKLHIPVMPSKDFENPLGLTLQTNAVFGSVDANT